MRFVIILFFVILVIGVSVLYLVLFSSEGGLLADYFGNAGDEGDFEEDESYGEEGSGYGGGDYGGGGAGNGNGGGNGAGGGESGGAESTEGGCTTQQISYSASNFYSDEICNQYQGDDCADKSVTCSVTMTNLDYETGGVFEMLFKFFEAENAGNVLFSASLEEFIGPREQHIFEETFNVQGDDANLDIDCFYETLGIPLKEICY